MDKTRQKNLYYVRAHFKKSYGVGNNFIMSVNGRIMLYTELEFKNDKSLILVFIDKDKRLLGFEDGQFHTLDEVKPSSIVKSERPY
jgi:hypothetical protein